MPSADPAMVRLLLLGSAMGVVCRQRGLMVLHASAVAFGDRVVAFAGPSGAGKSTLAAHCVKAGALLVADDLLVVSLPDNGPAVAFPGMPRVKLWSDALLGLGSSSEGLTPDWLRADKFHVPCADTLVREPLPLTQVCILGEDELAGDGTMSQLKGTAALTSLVANTYRAEYLDDVNGRPKHFKDCVKLAASTNIVALARRRDPGRLCATAALVSALAAA